MATNYSSQPSKTVDLIQRYGRIMWDVLDTYFPTLWSAPNSFYIMMSTMELESGYRIVHGSTNPTPNHAVIGVSTGIGKSYWYDPIIVPLRESGNPTVKTNIIEGLSAKALMATMGMYQVRNCRESNSLINGYYRDLAESLGLMVNAGESISAKFPNNDTGARNSMVLGAMIMEQKYKIRAAKNSPELAMRLAVGDYVGKAGMKDILGTSPEMRIDTVFSNTGKRLLASKVFSDTIAYYKPPINSKGQSETKNTVVASTDNTALSSSDCNRLG